MGIAEDSDRKYDEASRRNAMLEVDLERAEQRGDDAEAKIQELEEELKVVGNNMKSLEVSEAEALAREESYEETLRDLSLRFKELNKESKKVDKAVMDLGLLEFRVATAEQEK